MAARLKVLFDLNIVLDVLQKREPFFTLSAKALASAETGQVDGVIAAHSVTTLFYLITKDQSAQQARTILMQLLEFLKVATVDQRTIELALSLPYKDFEDAVQMAAALQAEVQCLVTRNEGNFQGGPLETLKPGELLALI
jgi:predicted nucleic acid-binding protein